MNLFFELLQVSLGTRDKLSRVPSLPEWEEVYEEACRQAIVGVLLEGLQRCMVLGQAKRQSRAQDSRLMVNLPPELKLQWIGEVQMMEAEYKVHRDRAKELTRRFSAAGFKSCVLKGLGTAQLYPYPERRQCGDIDLWVSGRRKDVMQYMQSEYTINGYVWHHAVVEIFNDVPTEIHFHPIWLYNPFRNWRLQRWFKEQKPAQMLERETGFGYPSVEFNAIYSLVHTFHHLMDEGVGLRHVIDYFYILKRFHTESKGNTESTESTETKEQREQSQISFDLCRVATEEDKSQIVAALQRFGLMRFLGAMMYVMKVACGMASEYLLCKPDEKAGKFLLDEIMLAGNFGQYDERTAKPEDEGLVHRNVRKFRRQLRFLEYYPTEVLCAPIWKTWHKGWRICQKK